MGKLGPNNKDEQCHAVQNGCLKHCKLGQNRNLLPIIDMDPIINH